MANPQLVDPEKLSLYELQSLYNELHAGVQVAQPQVDAMKKTYEEAEMVLANMKFRRGKAAYWLTVRKGQR